MDDVNLKLSILDQSPVGEGDTQSDALRHTIELAQKAEQWGYHRFWVAEHHNSERYVGSSPEVLMSHLLAHTNRIRIGSGGVMLQHYSPYKVAENFNVLASLAPGRVDLGIGRGPGGLPRTTRALQQEFAAEAMPFRAKLVELGQLLRDDLAETHQLYGLQAKPVTSHPADIILLGTTVSSAELAADLGIPYVFALFLNSDDAVMGQAVDAYRNNFNAAGGTRPEPMLALPIIVTDTDQEAAEYASEIKVVRITLESGQTLTVGSLEAAEEFGRQAQQTYTKEVFQGNVIHGSLETVRHQLKVIQHRYGIAEVIAVTYIKSFQKRLHSYELLSQAFGQ